MAHVKAFLVKRDDVDAPAIGERLEHSYILWGPTQWNNRQVTVHPITKFIVNLAYIRNPT